MRLQGKKDCILAEEARALATKTYLSSMAESDDFFLKILEERYFVEVLDKMISTSTFIAFRRYKNLLTDKRNRTKKFMQNVTVLYRFYKKEDGSVHFRDYDD